MYFTPREQVRVNNVFPGVLLLIGSFLIGFGSMQPWVTVSSDAFADFHVAPSFDLGFDQVYTANGDATDLSAVIPALAIIIGLNALALLATRIRGLGALWRTLSLLSLTVAGLLTVAIWKAVNNPADVVEGYFGGRGLEAKVAGLLADGALKLGLVDEAPGQGLWMLTLGTATALVGAVIPAMTKRSYTPSQQPFMPQQVHAHPNAGYQQFPARVIPQVMPPASSSHGGEFGPVSYFPGRSAR